MGIFAWIVLGVFIMLYRLNLKDVYSMQKRMEQGKHRLTFREEIGQLLDKKFYILVLALPVNQLIAACGKSAIGFLDLDAKWSARLIGLFVNCWISVPSIMLLATGNLSNRDVSLYEAAKIDGAGRWKQFEKLTMPFMLFSTMPVLLGQFIGNFNNFGIFYFLRGGHISMSKKWKFGRMMDTGITYLILTAAAFVFFSPCLWLILASFSKSGTIYSFNGFFPKEYSFASFQKLFTDTTLYNYPRWFFNTLFVAAGSCILGTFLVILTAYTISRFTFAARKPMMKITMVLGMFPSFMGMIAVYLLMTQFNLINHLWGLILIYAAGAPMGYLTQKGFFDTIPKAIDEAARIDGATNFQVFTRINLPLSKPIIVYTALTSFTWPWSDFILPKLLLKEKDLYTVAVGLMSLDETEFARFAAGSVFIAVPIVILYFFLVKNMVNGMAQGAVKG